MKKSVFRQNTETVFPDALNTASSVFVMLPPARPSLHCSSTFLAPSITLVTVRVSELISKEGRLFKRKLLSEDKI